jgi:CheY-like chemotaxis protein
VTFTVSAPEGLWQVRADPVQLELAVLNLVLNARDALKQAGRIGVSAQNRVLREGEVEGLAPGEYVSISVRDDGEGIRPDVLARIFEPFFTTKPPGKGTGLGLAQVYAFSRQHNGTTLVDSVVGEGTSITILLPRASGDMARVEPPAAGAAGAARYSGTVLFVEDDSLVRGVVCQALEEAGYKVLVASNAEDALALARSRLDLDVVLTDVVMPGGQSGVDLAKTLRVLRPALPVVLASGYAEALQGVEGEFALVGKPYDAAQLAERLSQLISSAADA